MSATLPASPHSPYYNKALAARYGYDPDKFTEAVSAAGKTGNNKDLHETTPYFWMILTSGSSRTPFSFQTRCCT